MAGITALVLIIFIDAWSIAHGIFEIIGAILRKEIDNEWWLILARGALRAS
jgi:uncharacterized membrane protein HdeD (DUF308 family)